jgi:hypothetical protein
MKVYMPFLERFREPMLKGTKTWTSRSRKMGSPKDTFPAFGHEFEIVKVERRQLQDILHNHWAEEGFASEIEAFDVWLTIHRTLKSGNRYWVHVFRRISL